MSRAWLCRNGRFWRFWGCRQEGEIASGEPGSTSGASNQTPLACTSWAWLAQKHEPLLTATQLFSLFPRLITSITIYSAWVLLVLLPYASLCLWQKETWRSKILKWYLASWSEQ
jgi:hypothetical protein